MTRAALLLLVVGMATPARAQRSTAECDRGGTLSAAGIGALRIGITADSLSRICRIISREVDAGTTKLRVVMGIDTVDAIERGGRVDWIVTHSPAHRTRDSLGVGSSVERLLDLPDIDGTGFWPEAFVVYPTTGPHCGLGFTLDEKTAVAVNAIKGDVRRALGMRGAGGKVAAVEIRGPCPERR